MPGILDEIIAEKRQELALRKEAVSLAKLEALVKLSNQLGEELPEEQL